MDEKTTRFYLVRHGQTEWNLVDKLRGRSDISLDEVGFRQVTAAGKALSGKTIVAVYSSPLIRAVQTAEALAAPHGLKPIVHEAFHDFDFGVWSGRDRPVIYDEYKEEYRLYKEEPHLFRAPGGESFWEVYERVLFGMKELNEAHPGAETAVATHNVTSIIMLLAVMEMPLSKYWMLDTGNASISRFTRSLDGSFRIECVNDTSHLAGI